MNITEKILARAAGKTSVKPGEIIEAKVDIALSHEKAGPGFFDNFERLNLSIWDKDKVIVVGDHAIPPSNIYSADCILKTRNFVRKHELRNYYMGKGICHQIMPEEGFVRPGSVIVGADSHTVTQGAFGAFATAIGSTEMAWLFAKGTLWFRIPEALKFVLTGPLPEMIFGKDLILKIFGILGIDGATYKTMEFTGSAVDELSIDGRMALCNMVVDAGAKNGIINPDEKTYAYLEGKVVLPQEELKSDPEASYSRIFNLDISELEPQVACPHSMDNVVNAREISGIKIDQAFIGTCTGGRMEDLNAAARFLRNQKVHPDVMLVITPASNRILKTALKEGLIETFIDAGAMITNPNCGACGGGGMGVLGKDEVCISTSSRNNQGRMGHPESQIYLGSAATVAASAVRGEIVDPREMDRSL
jgi:methanogen homoaconitase large subunit